MWSSGRTENRQEFLSIVRQLKKEKTATRSVAVVGRTNAGKSSLLNAMFGLNGRIGATRTTSGVSCVYAHREGECTLDFFDVFGFNDTEPYEDVKYLNSLVQLHAALLLYSDDILSCRNVLQLFSAGNVPVLLVRSKIDIPQDDELKDIIAEDEKKAREFGAAGFYVATVKGLHKDTVQDFREILLNFGGSGRFAAQKLSVV
mmetsp:Transcript_35515/g.87332  ORF Transcript_35515/g.87332 Transcript_35515/m.87332 type:complete len:202 (+) Transcript_35515:574-1179(+)